MILTRSDVIAASRGRRTLFSRRTQRGFIINPFAFGSGGCFQDGLTWNAGAIDSPETSATGTTIIGGSGTRILSLSRINNAVNYVYTSDDGLNWTRRTIGSNLDVRALIYVRENTWIAPLGNGSTNSVTRRTTDGGVTWSSVTHGASSYYYGTAANDDGSIIRYVRYNATATVVSTDYGASFSAGPAMPAAVTVRSMAFHANKWYVLNTSNNTVYVLDEVTDTWSTWDKFTSTRLNSFHSRNGLFFAFEETGGFLNVSDDDGATWSNASGTDAWRTARRTGILYHPDGFWIVGSRAGTSDPLSIHASLNGVDWVTMPTSVPIPSGTGVSTTGFGIIQSLGTVVAGSMRHASTSIYQGAC